MSLKDFGAMKNMLFAKYKIKATKRGYEFSLPRDVFISLIGDECHYCGSSPMNSFSYDRTFLYNGIDRVDNAKGYIEGNVVTCCRWCNQAKSTMSYKQFISYIERVYNHMRGK